MKQIGDSGEGIILAERAHAEDLGFGYLLNAPDAVLVHQQFEDFPGPALEATQEILIAVEEGFGLHRILFGLLYPGQM